jgi:hypothetical protein
MTIYDNNRQSFTMRLPGAVVATHPPDLTQLNLRGVVIGEGDFIVETRPRCIQALKFSKMRPI